MSGLSRQWFAPAVFGIALVVAPLAVAVATPVHNVPSRNYLVLYSGSMDGQRAQAAIGAVGGSVVAVHAQLGIAFARSGDASFTSRMSRIPGVVRVTPTDRHVMRLPSGDRLQNASDPSEDTPTTPEPEAGSLTARQWDMKQIQAVDAHRVNPGSEKVLVGVLDTGIDYTHPNLAPNIDFGNSVSCVGGTPNTSPSAWNDDNGHGTHVAGTIAASSEHADGLGIDGVAPGVRVAAVKTGDINGDFFLEAVVCAFTWAGDHRFNVTNNSYYSDPWLYHCLDDPDQNAIWVAETRALNYAASKGVVNVVSAGNFNDDLANPTFDVVSPNSTPPSPAKYRDVSENCFVFPSMAPGVVNVSSVGQTALKSYYSSYGTGFVTVTAPGGDARVKTTENPDGRILSTYPARFQTAGKCGPTRNACISACTTDGKCALYAWLQGTSMSGPHAAGVVALIQSRRDNGAMSSSQVIERLKSTATQLTCPPNPYNPTVFSPNYSASAVPPGVERHPAHCEGTPTYNNFYGYGLVNALRAVS